MSIETRHQRACAKHRGGARCTCRPSYRVEVQLPGGGRARRTLPTKAEARAWEAEARVSARHGALRADSETLAAAASAMIAGMQAGTIRARGGKPYAARVVNGYEAALRDRVLPALGARRLADVKRADLALLVDRLLAAGCSAAVIRNALMPVRVVYRLALERDRVAVNPTVGLRLPSDEGVRDRIATPDESWKLLAALRPDDQALWGTAFYAGLRRGELLALDWSAVDLEQRVIRVERQWDEEEGFKEPKGRKRRTVPIPKRLAGLLVGHRAVTARAGGLVFGSTPVTVATPTAVRKRALRRWRAAGLDPIGLHEARHTYASLMIAAGVNAKALSSYMGHSSIQITFDRYGHLMPGNEDEAAALLDAYLDREEAG